MSASLLIIIFEIVILVFSAIIHEVSHGYAAYLLGDETAKNQGRLTLNPIKHLDPFGSIFLPLMLYLSSGGSFVFGWAKPVPYNPFNLKNPKSGSGLIALAGPLSNFVLACLGAVALKLITVFNVGVEPVLLQIIILVNLSLMIFNLVPIPPLDGSKVLFSILPKSFAPVAMQLERYGIWILILFLFFGFQIIFPIVSFLYNILA